MTTKPIVFWLVNRKCIWSYLGLRSTKRQSTESAERRHRERHRLDRGKQLGNRIDRQTCKESWQLSWRSDQWPASRSWKSWTRRLASCHGRRRRHRQPYQRNPSSKCSVNRRGNKTYLSDWCIDNTLVTILAPQATRDLVGTVVLYGRLFCAKVNKNFVSKAKIQAKQPFLSDFFTNEHNTLILGHLFIHSHIESIADKNLLLWLFSCFYRYSAKI